MSYEGYEEILCKNGHLSTEGCYTFGRELWKCPTCGEGVAYVHGVNQTNCGGHPFPFREKELSHFEECPACGHKKLIKEATYHVPTEAELIEFNRSIICEDCGYALEGDE